MRKSPLSNSFDPVLPKPLILLTGATGYVGGRLLPRLLDAGFRVRCMARQPERLSHFTHPHLEVVEANLFNYASLVSALRNVNVAYYLAHSLGLATDFEIKEQECAVNFARACHESHVKRIIYLGGLGSGDALSPHLRTRHEVGHIFKNSGVQTIEFRASIIIGSGSLSFEMVRALVDRLPVMITPRWVSAKAQPIAIEDILDYLLGAIDLEIDESKVFEIGGPDIVSYLDIMREYAKHRELRRLMIPIPLLTPYLSSLWLGLVTPLYARVGRKLIDSIRSDTLVQDNSASKVFPFKPRGFREAIDRAIKNEDAAYARTRWSDAYSAGRENRQLDNVHYGSRLIDSRSMTIKCTPEQAFAPLLSIGGKNGWYYANWAWQVRGFIDLLVGGIGVRRGHSHPERIAVGDAIDFWRVEAVEPNRLLRLRAEMKLPGRAWLQFEIDEKSVGVSKIQQTAIFDPHGLSGLLYWYGLYPIHLLIFGGMLRGIAERALKSEQPSYA